MAREFAKKFYNSKKWKECREEIFNKYFGLCAECGKPGEEVHHIEFITPLNIDNPEIVLGHNNLILLCKDCHFDKHRGTNPLAKSFKNKKKLATSNGYYFDKAGNLLPIDKYIVYGSPGSGKSKYVKEHRGIGDLVVDLDLIKQAVSMANRTNDTDNLLDISLEIREYIYKRIENNEVNAKAIWIVAALPKRKERDELCERLRADLIFIDKDINECLNNAYLDINRKDKTLEKYIIEKWFADYEP
ncbi:HNH endonuclease signature motif containing protein [uncultured Clostridium sp.]|uniref:HNH endonuclease signature motif containing protein n=1 Tax=uncultured Clostridium sp. TaxID=59620 RepID=UPI002613BC43|nr:HNH endonuclease signature motif containing protein [uncultured Clostridium sp.]